MMTHETNPWGSSLDKLKEWDPKGAELLLRVGTSPWTSGVLPRKEVELISSRYIALARPGTKRARATTSVPRSTRVRHGMRFFSSSNVASESPSIRAAWARRSSLKR
jgi:hypothetical protein